MTKICKINEFVIFTPSSASATLNKHLKLDNYQRYINYFMSATWVYAVAKTFANTPMAWK